MKLWALTTFFNPEGYQVRHQNYCTFRRCLGLPLITVEWAKSGQFQLCADDADRLVQCKGGHLMWQKERLLAIGLSHLPDDCEAVVMIDADVVLTDKTWIDQLREQLRRVSAVQLFREVRHLPPLTSGEQNNLEATLLSMEPAPFYLSRQSFADLHIRGPMATAKPTRTLAGGPQNLAEVNRLAARPSYGHAWAFQREWLNRVGLYEHNVAGSGDLAMAMAIAGRIDEFCHSYPLNSAQQTHYRRWAEPVARATGLSNLGRLDAIAWHLFHGHLSRRGYRSRLEFLSSCGFDPDRDLMAETDKPFQWTKTGPLISELQSFFQAYFCHRDEDSEAVST